MTLNTYGHVMRELREAPKTSATDAIYAARAKDPEKTPQRENAISGEPEDRAIAPEADGRTRTGDPFITRRAGRWSAGAVRSGWSVGGGDVTGPFGHRDC
jgi:hypothetical protein